MEYFEEEDNVERVPVTILTGFLGSGKTTLFNHILTASHGKKIAVIQNEFGEVGIDDRLMAKNTKFATDQEIVEVLNGCVCCSVRKDLIAVLKRLAARSKAGQLSLDAIVIETTGMANPAPVAQTFLVEDDVRRDGGLMRETRGAARGEGCGRQEAFGSTSPGIRAIGVLGSTSGGSLALVPRAAWAPCAWPMK